VALPCIGLDGIGAGLKEVGWDGIEVVHAFDVDTELIPALQALHGRRLVEGWNLGSTGDLLRVDLEAWQDVDLIISGPPCPPWSSIGQQKSRGDCRARVFERVTEAIKEQARRGVLLGFVIEMVVGISHCRQGVSYHEEWMCDLQNSLAEFYVCAWTMQSADYLPQYRERLYTVGLRRDVLGTGLLLPPRLPSSAQLVRASLNDILHQGLPQNCEECIHGQQQANLMEVKRRILAYRPQGAEACYCFSIDRDPNMSAFAQGRRSDGNVCTLRTNNECIWVLMVNSEGSVVLSRCLHPVERLSLQGFRPELAEVLSKRALLRFTGNACTAPVITSVLRQLVLPLAHPGALGVPDVPRPLDLWQLSEDVAHHLAKARRLNSYRNSLAIMEQLILLEAMSH
jgi:site-specific DNA-cytosine methylase